MDLRTRMAGMIVARLGRDILPNITDGLDFDRKADCAPHGRRAAYAVAYGVFGDLPDSPFQGDEGVWEQVLEMFDAVCDLQRDDDAWTWYVPRTGKSHTSIYVWNVYAWLRTLQDFGDRMDDARRERITTMLRRAMTSRVAGAEQYLRVGTHPASNNIFINTCAELWLAGRMFDESSWMSLVDEVMARDIATQTDDGWWPDGNVCRGPTTLYNTVTLKGVAIYALLTGNADALRAVERAGAYHRATVYPDGSCVETIDERNPYRPIPLSRALWSFAPFENARGHAAFFAECAQSSDLGPDDPVMGAFEIDTMRATPEGDIAPSKPKPGANILSTIPAVTVSSGPWYACLSGATTQVPSTRFHHDLQNHVSVWHKDLGLFLGGGNSLHDPLFSSFRFQGNYLADSGEVLSHEGVPELRLQYGPITARVSVEFPDANTVHLRAEAEGPLPPDSQFAIQLMACHGKTITHTHFEHTLEDWPFWYGLSEEEGTLTVGPLALTTDRLTSVMWPCPRVDIYDPPRKHPVEKAILRVSANLCDGPACITIKLST